jgi:hypothetical protein
MSFCLVLGGYWGFVNPQPVIIGQSFSAPWLGDGSRICEDDAGQSSFLRRQESIAQGLKNGGARDQGHCAREAEES